MPTTTSRLGIQVPALSDPANGPSDMSSIANDLDGGANANYSGVAVFVATPGTVGAVPASPIKGTLYAVNGVVPYMLYYTGEATTGTATVPTGYRLVGGPGVSAASITNTSPSNAAQLGSMPVWAPLDHQHASLPWSSNQTSSVTGVGHGTDGDANAYARANHAHYPAGFSGVATTAAGGPLLLLGGEADGTVGSGTGAFSVVFANAFTTATFSVTATMNHSGVLPDGCAIAVTAKSRTGFSANITLPGGSYPTNGVAFSINWIAVGN